MRVAVVGSGVSGLVTAWRLARAHEVTVFEAEDRVGGHVHTVDVEADGTVLPVDTGFIVFNEPNYPGFCRILRALDVESQPSDMSFGVQCARTGLEYRGTNVDTLFAQRRNLLRPRFWRMLRDILRFNREAPELLEGDDEGRTLGEYVRAGGYSRSFLDHYLVPMGSALWSARPGGMETFPARYFVEFFQNHGLFRRTGRPEWRVVTGGSRRYVEALTASFAGRLRTRTPVRAVERLPEAVRLEVEGGEAEAYDAVVLATHSDQALVLLRDPSPAEREVLGAIPYQPNETVLHTDERLMPRARRAWASWNVHVPDPPADRATVTYHMNRLQGLPGERQYFVTLNRTAEIDPTRVLRRLTYHHPVYTPAARRAQARRAEVNGARRTWFCGAYWGYGFHEDGVQSALAVARDFGVEG